MHKRSLLSRCPTYVTISCGLLRDGTDGLMDNFGMGGGVRFVNVRRVDFHMTKSLISDSAFIHQGGERSLFTEIRRIGRVYSFFFEKSLKALAITQSLYNIRAFQFLLAECGEEI